MVARSAALARPPLLGGLAAAAAFGELLAGRVAARGFLEALGRSQRLALDQAADLLRNLGTVAALVALALGIRDLLGVPALSLRRRFLLAGFSGVLAGACGLALVTPGVSVGTPVVALAAATGHVVAILLAVSAAAWAAPTALRLALGTWASGLLFALGNLVLLLLAPKLPWHALWTPVRQALHAIAFASRHSGEVAFLLAPLAVAWLFVRRAGAHRLRSALGLLAAALLGAGLVLAARHLHDDFPVLLYGAVRLSLLAEHAPMLYGPLLGLALAAALRALLGPEPYVRQLGAGLLLLYAAGYAPRTAAGGLWLAVGSLLVARAAMSWAAFEPPQPLGARPAPSAETARSAEGPPDGAEDLPTEGTGERPAGTAAPARAVEEPGDEPAER